MSSLISQDTDVLLNQCTETKFSWEIARPKPLRMSGAVELGGCWPIIAQPLARDRLPDLFTIETVTDEDQSSLAGF